MRADSSKPEDAQLGSQPEATKSLPVRFRWRSCNCTEFYMEDGVIRRLLVENYPELARLNREPCAHWQEGVIDMAAPDPEATDE